MSAEDIGFWCKCVLVGLSVVGAHWLGKWQERRRLLRNSRLVTTALLEARLKSEQWTADHLRGLLQKRTEEADRVARALAARDTEMWA